MAIRSRGLLDACTLVKWEAGTLRESARAGEDYAEVLARAHRLAAMVQRIIVGLEKQLLPTERAGLPPDCALGRHRWVGNGGETRISTEWLCGACGLTKGP